MQDRLKFRVFISDKKNSKNSLTGMFKVHSLHTGTDKAIITSLYGNCSIKLENNVLMQCTGLKDKNGKLIYEGDIVKNNQNSLYSVEFEEFEHQTKFCLKRIKNSNYYPHISTWQGIGYKDQKNFEVIGNIYENPELLEVLDDR